ncbi:MAG: hypothetical protein Q7R41_03265, partial [Phycisphaerales bacterium]|nr:hypothetical protein [Phycisphaerales bacterium]
MCASTWLQNCPAAVCPDFCGNGGFSAGWYSNHGQLPCCKETCHENPGGDHLHCTIPPDCQPCPPDPTENCTNDIDDDGDGLCDCKDPGCATDPACAPPLVCEPNSTLTGCKPQTCLDLTEECLAQCGKLNPFTGLVTVESCDCRGVNECHLIIPTITGGATAAAGGGNPCVVVDNGGGTVTLPPDGCEYLSPDEVHVIVDGLPAGTTIELAPIHKDFICNKQGTINPVCSFAPPFPGVDCDDAGGSLGGEKECNESTLEFDLSVLDPGCTSSLCGWTRPVVVPMGMETHTAPRTPGDPVQSFDTDMFRMFGQINNIGDPDFDLLRIVGGTDFGLPSPGHTTLTKLPGGAGWAVDSFFDITYRIDFVGAPGGRLAGRSGSTTATIRMQTGGPFQCEGGCPTGFVCEEYRTVNADGTIDLCCDCIPEPVTPCPVPAGDQWCPDRQATDCAADHSTDVICLVRGLRFPSPTADPIIEKCDCFDDIPACGPVNIVSNPLAGGYTVDCPGPCPPGAVQNCEVHVNGIPTGFNSRTSGQIPPFALVTCDCTKRPPPDPHRSVQGTRVSFGTADVPAIPAGFFDPGSDPFSGDVNMQPGPNDTLIQRSGAIVCPIVGLCNVVQTEIVALDLVSASPITVTGGGPPSWNVKVGLSVMPQSLGTLTATKTHANGGTWDAVIHVLPRLTFTEVGNPGNVKTIDYGLEPIPGLVVNFTGADWVINLGPLLVGTIAAPNDGNFVPGVQEPAP